MNRLPLITIVSLFGVAVGLSPPAAADDILPPSWRGQPRSTMQLWEFSNGADPAAPDQVSNPYGMPILNLTSWAWHDWFWARQGIVSVGAGGCLPIELPNYPRAGRDKYLWVQITYWSWRQPHHWEVMWDTGHWQSPTPPLIERRVHSDGWVTDVHWITIPENPPAERLEMWFGPNGTYVDQVVVDTLCIPFQPDVNGDGVVDVRDLLAVLAAWGNTSGPEDINGDGIVNVQDLLLVLANWT